MSTRSVRLPQTGEESSSCETERPKCYFKSECGDVFAAALEKEGKHGVRRRDVKSFLQGLSCKTNVMGFNVHVSSQQQQFGPKQAEENAEYQITSQESAKVLFVVLKVSKIQINEPLLTSHTTTRKVQHRKKP